ncbi:MAG: MBL fold metallo-hydrolase [Verrucomicrobium sp.]|nr:MBL fold metallo-hydrolase [Verrucomicrobium sp.]
MLPLEDGFADIIGKAQRGLKLSDEVLCREAGVSGEDFQRVKGGDFNEEIVRKLAEPLRLAPDRLVALGSWHPNIAHPSNLARVTTPFDGGTVNAYLIWDEETKEAALFDTGMDAGPLLQAVRDRGLTPKYIFVTHTHSDHIAELPNLARATGLTPLVHESQDIGGVRLFKWGQTFPLGKLKVETRRTTGHAEGGTTFVVSGPGLDVSIAVVGDAIFAGSMGRGNISHEDALETNRQSIFSLPDQTVLCPGHGPLTTVGLEKRHNPFFPEFHHS